MPKHWKEDQIYLVNSLPEYRGKIENKTIQEARKMTISFAEQLYRDTPQLQHRSIQSIIERLPYLDNLLAGVFEQHNYAIKDQFLYGTSLRKNGDKKPNLCNTRHSYNGALR